MTREGYGSAYQVGFDRTVRFLLSRGISRETARESAQVAWARGWERLAQLREDASLLTWVNTIALNACRAGMRHQMASLPQKDPRHKGGIDLNAIDVARLLNFCSPSDRLLLEECLVGDSTKEIANRRGVSETAIRIRLLRARRTARLRAEKRAVRLKFEHRHAA